jgi:hypothetical protein
LKTRRTSEDAGERKGTQEHRRRRERRERENEGYRMRRKRKIRGRVETTVYRRREGIIPVEGGCLCTVDIVPPVACELLLVEQRTIGTQERGPLVTFPSVMADMVRLNICKTSTVNTSSP